MKKAETQGLNWNHRDLDRVCKILPEFESLLLVCNRPSEQELLWRLAQNSLIPAAIASGLHAEAGVWSEEFALLLEQRRSDRPLDIVFVFSDEVEKNRLQELSNYFRDLSCAVLFVLRVPLPNWKTDYDLSLSFENEKAFIHTRNGDVRGPFPCVLSQENAINFTLPSEAISAREGTVATTVGTYGLGLDLEQALRKVLEASGVRLLRLSDLKNTQKLDLVLVTGAGQELVSRVNSLSKQTSVIATSEHALRDEDRIAAYRGGARAVLPTGAAIEEILAAVFSHLSLVDPSEKAEERLVHAIRSSKRDATWDLSEKEQAVRAYASIVRLQVVHANRARRAAGAFVFQFPALQEQIESKEWAHSLRNMLVKSLILGLRSKDLTFVAGDRLVVISHQMSCTVAATLARRMTESIGSLGTQPPRWKLISAKTVAPELAGAEAEGIIRSAFDADLEKEAEILHPAKAS